MNQQEYFSKLNRTISGLKSKPRKKFKDEVGAEKTESAGAPAEMESAEEAADLEIPASDAGEAATRSAPMPAAAEASEARADEPMVSVCSFLDEPGDPFRTGLTVTLIPNETREGRRIACVIKPLIYVDSSEGNQWAITVPEGFETDFASIPSYARGLIDPIGKHAEAAVVHDWLYTIGTAGNSPGRLFADQVFLQAMVQLRVSWLTRSVMYRAVRIGGSGSYGTAEEVRFRETDDLSHDESVEDKSVLRQTTLCCRPEKDI